MAQVKVYDGPWQEPERLRHYSGFLKYATPTGLGHLDVALHGYRGAWHPTEQIPDRIIGSTVCADQFCSPDPTAKGATMRFIATAGLTGERFRAAVSAQFYDWSMYSNPTYANPDGTSAQIFQFDRRRVFGLTGERKWDVSPSLAVALGTENRYDDIGNVGVHQTRARSFVNSLGAFAVQEASASLYGEATWRPFDGLRVIGGVRGDYYHYAVRAKDAAALASGQGSGHDSLVSPKLALAYTIAPQVELYANWGRGFHSNDVRGAANTATPVPVLVRGTGKELGGRVQMPGVTLTGTYFWLGVGSELRFVGDSNAVEPSGASNRRGYEIVAFWRPARWFAFDANYTASRARYDNGDYIPNAFENAAAVGASVVLDRWEGSVRLRHLGPYPLIEDNSRRDKGSTVVNLRGAWKPSAIQLYAEVLNVFNSRDKDISYYYESYVPSFDAAPTEGELSRVVEPRTMRVGVKFRF